MVLVVTSKCRLFMKNGEQEIEKGKLQVQQLYRTGEISNVRAPVVVVYVNHAFTPLTVSVIEDVKKVMR